MLGVPDALALAAFGGLTDVIPFVGGILATAPAALAALSRGPGVAQREADARAERAYARRAEGASAAQAAQTALEVAKRTQAADEQH